MQKTQAKLIKHFNFGYIHIDNCISCFVRNTGIYFGRWISLANLATGQCEVHALRTPTGNYYRCSGNIFILHVKASGPLGYNRLLLLEADNQNCFIKQLFWKFRECSQENICHEAICCEKRLGSRCFFKIFW